MHFRRNQSGLIAAALLAPLFAIIPAALTAPAVAAVTPVTNPPIEDTCGVDLTVVLDASGSISSSNAVGDVRDAADALLSSLSDTNSTARVTQFATFAKELAPSTLIDTASLGSGGVLRNAINGYYNPIPPRPPSATIWEYNGSGSPLSVGSYKKNNSQNQYTNWDQSLDQANDSTPELVVYVTDGDPTAFDFNQSGDPFSPGPPPDVAMRTDRTAASRQVTIDRAVQEANRAKSNGSRMLAIGVGSALSNPDSERRLVDISGPQVVRDANLGNVDSLNEIDVALVTDFEDLAQFMRAVTLQLCSPSLTIRKLAQSSDSATYSPAPGWDVTTTPRVPGGNGFNWILPNTTPAVSKTLSTNADGFAQFQWEPDPPEADSAALVAEDLKPNFIAGRPDGTDYRCELRNEDGDVRVVEGEFADPANPTFDLDPIGQEIVTCSMFNSYDYQPEIALAKVNSPTEVRGDLEPPAVVTSTYTATNPGNTSLTNVVVTDDRCGLVVPILQAGNNIGDTSPRNDALDPGEAWQFECDREVRLSRKRSGSVNVINTAEVQGNDPTGTVVTDTATDDVDVFVPLIDLVKLVNGQPAVTILSGTQVTYTYAVTNIGNTPLATPNLVDDTRPCTNPILEDVPGNGDAILDVGETWNYSCRARPAQGVVNTASVTATPLNPLAGNEPFSGNNPDVTDIDSASVSITVPGLTLTKSVDQNLVFPGTEVTYTYTAANTGTADLRNDTGNDGWVTDDKCSPVTQVVDGAGDNAGDDNADGLLNPGEQWQFECSTAITVRTINEATIVAQPVDPAGVPLGGALTRRASASVEVLIPGIQLTKTALVGVVLDPDAAPVSGPDVPTPRQAEYIYDVDNTGTVPISDVVLVDDRCASVTLLDGDLNGDNVLDIDEVWQYSCATALEREQGTPPPVNESGLVTNTATVTGTPFLPDQPGATGPQVSDTDTAQVLVIEPGLTLTKTASADAVLANSNVTYTITIENTGDVGLELVGPADEKCAPLTYTGGDTNNNGLVDGANSANPESWTFSCTRGVPLPVAPDTADVNTASVSAVDPLGNTYEAEDTVEVRVIDPAISLEKTVSETLVPAGSTVTYEFLVTNTGQSPIATDDVLAEVLLSDTSFPANPGCLVPVLIAKEGGNQDDFLDRDPAETWRYGCQGTITEPTTDIGLVRGIGGGTIGERVPVLDSAAAFVDVFNPGIEVEKTADPILLVGGGRVTYNYRVRNTGDVPLANVAERITDDTCSPVTYVKGDIDGDGLLDTPNSIFEDSLDETWVFTCTTDIDKTTTNTVIVEGSPVDPGGNPLCGSQVPDRILEPCDVRANDTATVKVVEPGTIIVTKETKPSSSETFKFKLRGKEFKLSAGDSLTFDQLAPGSYKLSEFDKPGWQLDALKCKDPSGNTAIDRQDASAVIKLKAGETVRCTFTNVGQQTGSGGLAPTGAPPWLGRLLALGAILVLAGGALMIARRRRTQTV